MYRPVTPRVQSSVNLPIFQSNPAPQPHYPVLPRFIKLVTSNYHHHHHCIPLCTHTHTHYHTYGIKAHLFFGYSSLNLFMYHLWCWYARGAKLAAVKTKKVTLAKENRLATANPHHSIISPKKFAPDTYSNTPPLGM